MLFIHRIRLFALVFCLLAGGPVLADSLRAVKDTNLDNLDEQARDSIEVALRQLNEALQAQPVSSDRLATAYGELGALYQVHFIFPGAEDCYYNAMQLAPDDFRWVYYAAYLADTMGQTRLALDRYEQARKLKPGYKALMVRLGNVLLDLNEPEQARDVYQQVVNATGLEAAALYGLGQVALLLRDYDTAIDVFTRALEYDPAASRIHYSLAQALRATQRNDEAKAQLAQRGDQPPSFKDPQIESLVAMKIGSRIHFIQAMKDIRKQDYEAASKAFARGLDGEPDNVLARISYARTLYLVDDKSGARQALETALALEPNNSLCLFLLGILAEEEGDAAVAAGYYQRAIRSIPDHAGAHHFLANQYYRQGNYASAAQHYASSLKGEPDNLGAMIPYHGTLLLGDAPAATLMTELESAIEHFPEYPGTRALQILLLAGSPDPAIHDPETALEKAQQLNGQYPIPPHRELLALAWAATGNYQKAVSILEELLPYVRRAMPAEVERVERSLAYYQDRTLPPLDKLINRDALQAPEFNAGAAFREYPAPRPY